MDFSVIIVSWNVKDKLRENLNMLAQSRDVRLDIIVIDNASADGTADMVANEFPDVRLIANAENLGFAKASNQGLREAGSETCVLLNPDMRVTSDTFANLNVWLKANPQAAIAGVRLRDEAGHNLSHVRRFPTVWNQAAIALKIPHLFPHILESYLRADFDYDHAAQVDSLRGSFFVIRRSTLEQIGFLDERYFIWLEEVDYCRAAKEKGLEVWYTPAAEAIDYVGASFRQVDRGTKQHYFRESLIKYFEKWQPWWETETVKLAWTIAEAILAWAEFFGIQPRAKT